MQLLRDNLTLWTSDMQVCFVYGARNQLVMVKIYIKTSNNGSGYMFQDEGTEEIKEASKAGDEP